MSHNNKTLPVISILGPTASGKTQLSLDIIDNLSLDCEIISVDSALVYKGMDIGTAKPSKQEQLQVPHHLIDICDVDQQYNVANFVEDTDSLIEQIHAKGKIPILVGGTMLYHHAFINGLAKLPEANAEIRQSLTKVAEEKGWAYLYNQLEQVDPTTASKIHANDGIRIVRALEVYQQTGQCLSQLQQQTKRHHAYPLLMTNLIPENRALLHQRIALRLEHMFANGFVEEVEGLLTKYSADAPGFRCVGYKQVVAYLQNDIDKKTMQEQALFATRQFAKRQITWLRRYFPNVFTLNSDETSQLIQKFLKNFHGSL